MFIPYFSDHAGEFLVKKFLAIALLAPISAGSAQVRKPALGIAWKVQGNWLAEGSNARLRSGDPVKPASLLQPGPDSGSHSITVLLPDGQRVLYECFTPADCARGFRVPALITPPDAFSVNLLERIRSGLAAKSGDSSSMHDGSHAAPAPKDEIVAVLNSSHRVRVGGLLEKLPNGRYTCELRPLDPETPAQHLVLEKKQPSVELTLPAPGLYSVIVTDAQNNPRVDLFLAAITPAQSARSQQFHRAAERMDQWNDDYAGWPIHDFLRAYLQSLMQPSKQARTPPSP